MHLCARKDRKSAQREVVALANSRVSRPGMRSLRSPVTALVALVLSASCVGAKVSPTSSPMPTATVEALAMSAPRTPVPDQPSVLDDSSRENEILQQIQALVAQYDDAIRKERLNGEVESITQAPDGSERVRFAGESLIRISSLYGQLLSQIADLNREYIDLYKRNHQPTPYPTLATSEGTQEYIDQLIDQYGRWVRDQQSTGAIVRLYEPYDIEYQPAFVGETYAQAEIWWQAIVQLQTDFAAGSPQEMQIDIDAIQRLDPGDVSLADIIRLPYRMDVRLFQYRTSTRLYTIYRPTREVVEIIPIVSPVVGGRQPKPYADLERTARDLIAAISPGVKLDSLTPSYGSKVENVFFRWEDRIKPLLDDGRSYPFVQVGLTAEGGLLNYVNTLPLSR